MAILKGVKQPSPARQTSLGITADDLATTAPVVEVGGNTVIHSTGAIIRPDGNTVVHTDGSITVKRYDESTRPTSAPDGTIIYNTDKRRLEIYNSTAAEINFDSLDSSPVLGGEGLHPVVSMYHEESGWNAIDKDSKFVTSTNQVATNAFLYRQIITTGYVMGGYKDSSPWKNVNRMSHATDVMTNKGDLLTHAGAYTSGACNLTKSFLWSCDDNFAGSSSQTTYFNMHNESSGSYGGSLNMQVGRNDCATIQREHYWAYIVGGGNSYVDIFNLTNETMLASSHGGATSLSGDNAQSGCGSFHDETKGYVFQESNNGHRIDMSTNTTSSSYTVTTGMGTVRGVHSQQKGISSKVGKGYCGNEGNYNGGYNLRRFQFSTETSLGNVSKPIGNSGEENFDMGQAHQYLMGMYDGLQNNRGWRFSYSTDSGYELSSGSVRTGVPGGSSGYCSWKG